MKTYGTLYVVATPIGNLEDISQRAINTLKNVNWIAAEDTRHSKGLLQQYSIDTPMLAHHNHNEQASAAGLIEKLQAGENIALISDAGTPLISDPGYWLVNEARNNGITVSPIPGCCAAITCLSVSGLPSDRFYFEGFLPHKAMARKARLTDLAKMDKTVIYYESVHRIQPCLKDIHETHQADRKICVGREITKRFESFTNGTVADIPNWIEDDVIYSAGEFVMCIEGAHESPLATNAVDEILIALRGEVSLKKSVQICQTLTKEPKNMIYQRAIELENKKL